MTNDLNIKRSQLNLTLSWREADHMETDQSIDSANHLTGSDMAWTVVMKELV